MTPITRDVLIPELVGRAAYPGLLEATVIAVDSDVVVNLRFFVSLLITASHHVLDKILGTASGRNNFLGDDPLSFAEKFVLGWHEPGVSWQVFLGPDSWRDHQGLAVPCAI